MTADLACVVLAGGGSAGHVSPLLAVADALTARHPNLRITAMGTEAGLEARLIPARGYELATIPKVVFPRRVSRAVLRLPADLGGAVSAAAAILRNAQADVLVGFGGYVSSPAYLAARRLGIPIVVHEGNARPGLANRLGARLTEYVATTFDSTRLPHAQVLGMPLRRTITTLDRAAQRHAARVEFGLEPDRPTLLVTGGSLGAQRLNEAFAKSASALTGAGIQVLHVSGAGKGFDPGPALGRGRYVVLPYVDAMERAYAAADLVVARAGANTVCELSAVGLPAVLVPLPIGNGEQRLNAAGLVAAGGAQLIDDARFTAEWIVRTLVPLALDGPRVAAMAQASAATGHRDADVAVATLVEAAASRQPKPVRDLRDRGPLAPSGESASSAEHGAETDPPASDGPPR